MAYALTGNYLEAMTAAVRRPLARVTAFADGVAREITADLVAWSVERHREHRAGSATLLVANPGGAAAWLAPGTRVTVEQGLRTAAGAEYVPVFTGDVCTAEALYRRGTGEVLTVRLLDRAGRAIAQEITSPRYTLQQANAIVTALFTDYGGLSPAEIQLAPADYMAPELQFVEESLMDAGHLLMQAARQRLYFDAAGVLRSAALALPSQPQWTVAARDIVWVQDTWAPPPATQVTVTGRLQASLRQVGEEVPWEEVTVSAYQFGIVVNVPFAPSGAVYEAVRIEPITPLSPFEQIALYSTTPTGITVKVVSPAGRQLTFRCYGKQVYYTTPHVLATAEDAALTARFGTIRREAHNPAVTDAATGLWLAGRLADEARWSQHALTLRLLANPGIEPGDVLALTHPRTGQALLLLANAVSHAGRRGREEQTTVEGWVLA
jgi:hypothetical protein